MGKNALSSKSKVSAAERAEAERRQAEFAFNLMHSAVDFRHEVVKVPVFTAAERGYASHLPNQTGVTWTNYATHEDDRRSLWIIRPRFLTLLPIKSVGVVERHDLVGVEAKFRGVRPALGRTSMRLTFSVHTGYNESTVATIDEEGNIVDYNKVGYDSKGRLRGNLSRSERRAACDPVNGTAREFLEQVAEATGYDTQPTQAYVPTAA